jgi:glycerol uptake facilitator-like aquaporin
MDVLLLGLIQLLTAPFLLIGWIWSINHGMAIFEKSKPEDAERGQGIENTMDSKQVVKHSCVKLMYELIGTGLWSLLFYTCSEQIIVLFFGLWILNSFTIRVSGCHFNPAISLAYSLRKDDKGISRKLAMAYMIA